MDKFFVLKLAFQFQVWKDLKYNLKKKLLHNKKEQKATGGGSYKQHQFSAYEETAINILAIDKIVNVEGATHGLNLTPINNDDEMDENPVSPMSSPILLPTSEKAPILLPTSKKAPSRKTKNCEENKENKMAERIDLLKEHSKLCQNIEKKMGDMAYYMKLHHFFFAVLHFFFAVSSGPSATTNIPF